MLKGYDEPAIRNAADALLVKMTSYTSGSASKYRSSDRRAVETCSDASDELHDEEDPEKGGAGLTGGMGGVTEQQAEFDHENNMEKNSGDLRKRAQRSDEDSDETRIASRVPSGTASPE